MNNLKQVRSSLDQFLQVLEISPLEQYGKMNEMKKNIARNDLIISAILKGFEEKNVKTKGCFC